MQNRIMMADSYKYSHTNQYPKGTTAMFSYLEARKSSMFTEVVFFGLQYLLKQYFSTPITKEELYEAKIFSDAHGIPFNYAGWEYIVTHHKGLLPVVVKAVPEGGVYPLSVPLLSVESTDEEVFWIASWLETFLLKVWYPTTVATRSYYVKKLLQEYAQTTQDNPNVDFQFHNFGYRGSSTEEAGRIGGVAHLTQFLGTDNFYSLKTAVDTYNALPSQVGYSIPATEHSTVTSWGRNGESTMMMNYLEENKGKPIIACVMDSYDYLSAVSMITSGDFKTKIESPDYPTFVIRPDSGEQVDILNKTLDILEANSVSTITNDKGFKVLSKYRIIFGDGINLTTISDLLTTLVARGYSSENVAFGSGGWLMQDLNRDTLGFAIKCSSITINDEEFDVYKDPITDTTKKSKKGRVFTVKDQHGNMTTETNEVYLYNSILDVVFEYGELTKEVTLEEVRNNSKGF